MKKEKSTWKRKRLHKKLNVSGKEKRYMEKEMVLEKEKGAWKRIRVLKI